MAQKTADMGTVTFEKSTKSIVSYQGIGVEYYKPAGLYSDKSSDATSNGFGLSYEIFSPFRPKTAVTFNSAFKYMTSDYGSDFKYKQTSVEINLGLHQLIAKGLYIKPQLGLANIRGSYDFNGDNFEQESVFKGTYGAQAGYLFRLGSERPKFIDAGLMYQSYFGGGSYLGFAAKYLIGPKN
jgi:hypothetical protein